MSPDTIQRIDTALIWILIIALIAVVSGWQYTSAGDDDYVPLTEQWVRLEHESGAIYMLRKQSIVGFYRHSDRDVERPNEIMISGGRIVYTGQDIRSLIEQVLSDGVP